MKKLFFCLLTLLIVSQTFGSHDPKWNDEKKLWNYYDDLIIGKRYQNLTFYKDISIQLIGNFTREDTLFIDSLISVISPFIQRVKIYRVISGGNLALTLNDNPDTSLRSYTPELLKYAQAYLYSDTIKQSRNYKYYLSSLYHYYGVRNKFGETIKNQKGIECSSVSLAINTDAPQNIRNKLLQYHIIRSLVPIEYKKTIQISKKVQDSTNIFSQKLIFGSYLSETDKYVIYKSYSKFRFFEIIKRSPQKAFSYLVFTYGNYSYLLAFSICFFIIIIYFLLLFRFNIIERQVFTWKGYMKKGMLIMQSVTLLYILYSLMESNIFYANLRSIYYILVVLAIPNFFCFLSLNLIYFLESGLIGKNTSLASKLLIQAIISFIPVIIAFLVVFLFFGIRSNVMFVTFLVTYSFLMIFIRIAYNYLQFKTQNTIKEKELELANMREMQHKAELQALQSRINPHFLYNSLNSIAGLAKTDAVKTEKMAMALSDFCRYAINKQNETFTTIEEEAEMAKTYLEIEKIRFGEKFNYSIDISDACKNEIIPRFLIQPLIENAIKHGLSKIIGEGKLVLKVTKLDEGTKIAIYDNGPAFLDEPVTGYGLQSIYDKLELLYKGKAYLNFINQPDKHIFLIIPKSNS